MKRLLSNINIQINDRIYIKDPQSSELGKKIISGSIPLIDQIGFESFTFKKLAKEISSTEASVYRYFESKHKLLLYLTSWYWGWMGYKMAFGLTNIPSAEERLEIALELLTKEVKEDDEFDMIDEVSLYKIVISESFKAYLTKEIDEENKLGAFRGYKQVVSIVSDIVTEINPDFKYPHMLISTAIEGSHLQRYFAQHLPRLTDDLDGEDSIVRFYKDMVFKTIVK